MCAQLLTQSPRKIYSDEMPLIKGGTLYPFPIRLALKADDAARLMPGKQGRPFQRRLYPTKWLFAIERSRVAVPAKINTVMVFKPGVFPRIKVFYILWLSIVVGYGLPQMAEHMLRAHSAARLIRIGFSRLWTALRLSVSAECKPFLRL
jgi:hypothetical protein